MSGVIPTESNISMVGVGLLGRTTSGAGKSSRLDAASVRSLCSVYSTSEVDTLLAGYQPLDSDLTAIAALTTTSFGRSLLTQADAAAVRTTIGAGTSSFDGAFSSLSGTPTTVSGYGITNAYTKTEVDNLVAGLLDFKGNQDCSANPNYPSALKGDAYYCSVAGKIGGASGVTVAVGDLIVCSADNAGGTQASVGSSWFVLEKNLDGALVSSNNLSDLASAATARSNLGLGTLATQSGTFSGTSSGTNTGDQTITLTGNVTGSGTGSFATTIANSAVTNAMLAGSIAISKLAITGTPDGSKFLRDDGTWAAASGGGGGITSLGGQTGATQTFLAATTGTDFAISSSGDVHTFAIPDASASARGLVTTGTQTIAGQKTFAQGTLTSSAPLTLTQTWNSGATTFTGMLLNVTDTASASASNLLVLQKSGSDRLTVTKNGVATLTFDAGVTSNALFIKGTDGVTYLTLGYPGSVYGTSSLVGFDVNGGVGKVNVGAGQMHLTYSGNTSLIKTYGNLQINPGVLGGGGNTVEILNGTTAQTFNIANTYTSSTNFEYGRFQWNTNQFRIGTAVGSAGGTGRSTVIGNWDSAGTWLPLITISGGGSRTVTHTARVNGVGSADVVFSADSSNAGAGFTLLNNNGTVWNVFSAGSATSYNDHFSLLCGSAYRFVISSLGNQQWFQGASTSGSPSFLVATAAAHTTLTASTEATDINFNLARTVQFAAGALTTQRAFRIQAPTYAFASASTITTAVTLDIGGAPVAGANATITTSLGLRVAGGALIGTSTSDKIAFWNATPIVQPTTGVASATRVGGGGTALTDTDTYDGYTIAQVVKALRNLGVLA